MDETGSATAVKCNVGTIDRVTRALIGVIVGSGGLILEAPIFRWPMVSVGAVLLFTAAFAWCPMYYAGGWDTKQRS